MSSSSPRDPEPWGFQNNEVNSVGSRTRLPRKGVLILIVIGLIALGLAGWMLARGQAGDQVTNQANPSVAPISGKQVDRPCYSFKVPDQTEVPNERTCEMDFTVDDSLGITITGYGQGITTAAGELASWKKAIPSNQKITNERTFDVAGYSATRFDVEDASPKDTLDEYSIIVIDAKSKYKVDGVTTGGFTIMAGHSNDENAKQDLENMLATWQWH